VARTVRGRQHNVHGVIGQIVQIGNLAVHARCNGRGGEVRGEEKGVRVALEEGCAGLDEVVVAVREGGEACAEFLDMAHRISDGLI
jgi:hypothetical protein